MAVYLTSTEYDKMMARKMENAIFITCRGALLDYENTSLIIYFRASHRGDGNWNHATDWFGVYILYSILYALLIVLDVGMWKWWCTKRS